MNAELTKSAKRSLATLYEEYLQRRGAGMAKNLAIEFSEYSDDIRDDRRELIKAGFVRVDVIGELVLTDAAIIFMENKKIDTIKEWLSFGAQFIP